MEATRETAFLFQHSTHSSRYSQVLLEILKQMNGHLNLAIYLSSYWLMPKNYNCKYHK